MTDRKPQVWTSDKELAGRLFAALDAMPFSEPGWYRVQEIAHELNERGEHGAVMQPDAMTERLVEALRKMVDLLESAGTSNLSRGVQLGQVSWMMKANDRIEIANAALADYDAARKAKP